jgi:hypothetical protein
MALSKSTKRYSNLTVRLSKAGDRVCDDAVACKSYPHPMLTSGKSTIFTECLGLWLTLPGIAGLMGFMREAGLYGFYTNAAEGGEAQTFVL